jgi:hypothetical protein
MPTISTRLLAIGLLLSVAVMVAPGPAVAEEGLQVSWTDSPMADGWRSVCGDVRNEAQVPARAIVIRVVGLQSTGQTVSTRDHYLLAGVPPGSRAVFCVPMPAGASSYTVTVLRADWGIVEAP